MTHCTRYTVYQQSYHPILQTCHCTASVSTFSVANVFSVVIRSSTKLTNAESRTIQPRPDVSFAVAEKVVAVVSSFLRDVVRRKGTGKGNKTVGSASLC